MKDALGIITQISGVKFRAASDQDLSALRDIGFPQTILDFYSKHEPEEAIEGVVRLWPISHIVVENTDLMPGCAIAPHGFFVFASTYCGDAYAFDSNVVDESGNPRIVLVSHEEVVEEKTTKEIVDTKAKQIASNFDEFLVQFAKGDVDEDCIY